MAPPNAPGSAISTVVTFEKTFASTSRATAAAWTQLALKLGVAGIERQAAPAQATSMYQTTVTWARRAVTPDDPAI